SKSSAARGTRRRRAVSSDFTLLSKQPNAGAQPRGPQRARDCSGLFGRPTSVLRAAPPRDERADSSLILPILISVTRGHPLHFTPDVEHVGRDHIEHRHEQNSCARVGCSESEPDEECTGVYRVPNKAVRTLRDERLALEQVVTGADAREGEPTPDRQDKAAERKAGPEECTTQTGEGVRRISASAVEQPQSSDRRQHHFRCYQKDGPVPLYVD